MPCFVFYVSMYLCRVCHIHPCCIQLFVPIMAQNCIRSVYSLWLSIYLQSDTVIYYFILLWKNTWIVLHLRLLHTLSGPSQTEWYTPLRPVHRKQRQVDLCELQDSQGYTVRSCLKTTKQTTKQKEATPPQQTANATQSQTAEKASEMMYRPPQLLRRL